MLFTSESYRSFLSGELVKRVKSNPRYSQRAFARSLGVSPGELSEILRGKRQLGVKSALKVAKTMGLNPSETKRLLYLVQIEKGQDLGSEALSDATPTQLSHDLFAIISDWYCFALLSLTECEGFRWNDRWIAKRLGVTQAEIRLAIERLKRVGLLETVRGKLSVSKDYVVSPTGIPSEAIRNYHRQILAKATAALDLQKPSDREITGATFPIDPGELPKMKKEIGAFLGEIAEKYGKGRKKREVFHLEIALLKLSEEVKNEA